MILVLVFPSFHGEGKRRKFAYFRYLGRKGRADEDDRYLRQNTLDSEVKYSAKKTKIRGLSYAFLQQK